MMVLDILLQLIKILTESTFWSYHQNPCLRNLFCSIQLANLLTEVICFRASLCDSLGQWCHLGLQGTSEGKGNGCLESGYFAVECP